VEIGYVRTSEARREQKRVAVCVSGSEPHFNAETAVPAIVCVCMAALMSGRAR
jgi:hypothetical protein